MTNPVPAGNTYDKFHTTNPIAQRLMAGFLASFDALYERIQPRRVLEVGCGEGEMLRRMQQGRPDVLVGFDLDAGIVRDARQRAPGAYIAQADALSLPHTTGAFDAVIACEVLEHVPDPARALAEMARVTQRYVILSVPREPLWRAMNMARGKYVSDWGNTPGHIQHWGQRQFVDLVSGQFRVLAIRTPLPWTMVLAELT